MVKCVKKDNLKNTSTLKLYNVETSKVVEEGNIDMCKKVKLFAEPSNRGLINDIISTYLEETPDANSFEVSDLLVEILMYCVQILIINIIRLSTIYLSRLIVVVVVCCY